MSVRTICAQLFRPPNPERAEKRSCPKRAISILSLEGGLVEPLLRASNEHIPIVRVP
jgi:hypothetical protein